MSTGIDTDRIGLDEHEGMGRCAHNIKRAGSGGSVSDAVFAASWQIVLVCFMAGRAWRE